MSQPIDVAYVDVVARDKSLDKLRKDIDKTFDDIDKGIESDLKKIDDRFDDTFDKIDKHFRDTEKHAKKTFDSVGDSIRGTFRDVDRDGNRVGQLLKRIFSEIGDHVGQLGAGIGKLGSVLGSFVTGSPLVALIVALVPAIIALTAALANLIGLVAVLPGSFGVLLSVIAPLVLAFQNFGEAVSAVASGDVDKINEALKKLSPSAADAVREIGKLLPQLRTFQKLMQEAFFVPFRGGITQLVTSFLPVLTTGFRQINLALGTFVKQLIDMLTTSDNLKVFADLFAATARIITTLTGPIIRLFDAINASIQASLPFVERIAAAFGRAFDAFAAFINKSIETGAFNKFIEDAFTTVKELIDLLKAVGGLLGTLFAGTEEAGHGLIKTLTDLTIRLDDFLKSAEGQQALRDLSTLADLFGQALGAVITSVLLLDKSFRISLKMFELIGRGFTGLITTIGDFFARIPAKIEEFKAFLAQVPAAILQAVDAAFTTLLQAIGVQIGLVLFAVQVLPDKIVEFIGSIPGRIREALASTGPTILEIFQQAFDDANAFIRAKFDEAVAFIQSVPERIAALGPIFLRAGKNLITSFMNGFRSVGSFIGDIAGDIVGAVRGFLNRAIDKINSGIAAIDAILPGNLGRIPRLAQGAVVGHRQGGTLAVVGEGREDEAVAPLSKLTDMIKKAVGETGAGASISFGPGSININFSGVVPTEGEARGVGVAVADGIASQLARRSVRTQVRAA